MAQLRDAKADLLLRAVLNVDDLGRNPDVIEGHLTETLREYYAALKRTGKTIKDTEDECSRCRPEPIGDKPVKAAEKTEMNRCGVNDLR